MKNMRFFLALALCYGCVWAQTKPSSAFEKPALEAYLRHLLAIAPDVQVHIDDPKPSVLPGFKQVDVHLSLGGRYQDETLYVSNDGKKIVRGLVYDINQNPFEQDLAKLTTKGDPSFGPENAPVTMIMFSDFQCPVCKEEAKVIRDNVPKEFAKNVRVVFKNLPLEAIHNWAMNAAIAGRCIYKQNPAAFWNYYDWIYEHQGDITADNLKDKVLEWAKGANLDMLQIGRCLESKETEPEIKKEIEEAKALHIEGTPTVFVNGRRLYGNYPWANLQQILNGELKYEQTAKDAADKCCEVGIPSPLKK